jgi:hypothetical protein
MSVAILGNDEVHLDKTHIPIEVRKELDSILVSEVFRTSPRCRAFLSYIVEAVYSGSTDLLKERNLGIALFNRKPDYDTGADAIVRVKAHETRRRLTQYNQSADSDRRVIITLTPGTYIPTIECRAGDDSTPAVLPAPQPDPVQISTTRDRRNWNWVYPGVGAICLLLVLTVAEWTSYHSQSSIMRHFWEPVFSQRKTVLCTSKPDAYAVTPPSRVGGDSSLALQMKNMLAQLGQGTRMAIASDLSENDLREAPVVLIGGPGANPWSAKMANSFRFQYALIDQKPAILDRQIPDRQWNIPDRPVSGQSSQDYVVITRLLHSQYGPGMISIAGSSSSSSHAGGLALLNAASLSSLLKDAPDNWARKNLQLVIRFRRTQAGDDSPQVIAAVYW